MEMAVTTKLTLKNVNFKNLGCHLAHKNEHLRANFTIKSNFENFVGYSTAHH